jgi:hypothetical protein
MPWDVGGVRVTRVVELVMAFPVDFVDAGGQYLMSFQTFVIEAGNLRIVVDTCTGNSKDCPLIPEFDQQHRPFLTQLAAAGFPPRQSISSSAPTCTLTTWVGTRVLSMENGYRRSPARAICSGR